MKIKTEKEQIREELNIIDNLIEWQLIKTKQAKRRYEIKKDWIVSFWILSDSSTLDFVFKRELEIGQKLNDYKDVLSNQLY
jgi:hypothetical protein